MRFAVVGTNFISREFVTAGRKLAGFSLAAVCSRRRETAEAFADSFGGARCLTSLEEVAACLQKRSLKTGNLKTFHQVDKNS